MIKGVIFDMDGLIFDTEILTKKIWQHCGQKRGYKLKDELFSKLIGSDSDTIARIFKKEYGDDFPYNEIRKEAKKLIKNEIREKGVPIKYGLRESLKFLEEKNIIKAIASSSSRQNIIFHLKSAQLENKFDFIVGGDEVEKSKPNPEIFIKCWNKIGFDKENILILEDSINGILAADKADIDVILIEDIIKIPAEIKKLAYKELNNLAELPSLIEEINYTF